MSFAFGPLFLECKNKNKTKVNAHHLWLHQFFFAVNLGLTSNQEHGYQIL